MCLDPNLEAFSLMGMPSGLGPVATGTLPATAPAGSGRAWRFDGPWDWSPFGSSPVPAPVWPLTLISRGGEADPGAAAAIEQATAMGSHEGEVAR